MRRLIVWLPIVAMLAVASCVSFERDKITTLRVHPVTQDDPSNKLMRLSYKNETNKKICLSESNWPSKGGIIDNDGDEFYLIVESQKYYLGRQMDYCPKCGSELPPGEEIRGVLHYASFGLPEALFDKPKELVFVSTAWICPDGLE